MKSKILSSTLVILGFILGASALSTLAAWTAPQSAPPACAAGSPGCDAPLHVGSVLQTKLGTLSLNSSGAGSYGLEVVNGIKLITPEMLSTPSVSPAGKVLVADANGVGTWGDVTGAGGSNIVFLTTPVSLNDRTGSYVRYTGGSVPAGAGYVILESIYTGTVNQQPSSARVDVKKGLSATNSYTLSSNNDSLPANNSHLGIASANQGIFPVESDGSFAYKASATNGTITLRIIGYIINGSGTIPAGLVVGGYMQDTMSISNPWGVGTDFGCPSAYTTVQSAGYNGVSYFQCLTK